MVVVLPNLIYKLFIRQNRINKLFMLKLLLLIIVFLTSCSTIPFIKKGRFSIDNDEGLFTVIQFNNALENNDYNKSFLFSLIDTINFNAKLNSIDNTNAKNIYYEFNKYNSKKFKNGFDYTDLNYESIRKKDTLVIFLFSKSFFIDSNLFKLEYEYKLVKTNNKYVITSYNELTVKQNKDRFKE